jgi:hypothetical protein
VASPKDQQFVAEANNPHATMLAENTGHVRCKRELGREPQHAAFSYYNLVRMVTWIMTRHVVQVPKRHVGQKLDSDEFFVVRTSVNKCPHFSGTLPLPKEMTFGLVEPLPAKTPGVLRVPYPQSKTSELVVSRHMSNKEPIINESNAFRPERRPVVSCAFSHENVESWPVFDVAL